MGSVIAFNAAVTVAWWIGTSFTALGFFCIAFMLWLRGWTDSVKRRREGVMQKWEDTLFQATEIPSAAEFSDESQIRRPEAGQFPVAASQTLEKKDLPYFLYEWNYLHESLAGEAKKGLNLLAQKLGLSELTLELLKSRFLDRRLLAINTLGNLGESATFAEIENLLAESDPVISSWAWRALFRIDTERTIEKHLSKIVAREDWSPIFVAKVLKEIEADTLSERLCRLVETSYESGVSERQMSRLISYLILAHVSDYDALVNRILLESDEREVLIACLRLINSDAHLTRIRALLGDARWEVRMQAVLTLGRIGQPEDIELLLGALNDADWWVRYRTASVLLSLPAMTDEKIERLAETLPNRFARDILLQVLTEKRLLCFNRISTSLSR